MNDKIKAYFTANPNQYISGEQLSEQLGISRSAVWKHIKRLRNDGYTFEAIPRKGYKLLHAPPQLDIETIEQHIKHECSFSWNINFFKEADSTQNLAHQAAKRGEEAGYVVIAEQQLAGRGRMGKSWHSPAGKGIWMSFIIKPSIPLAFMPQLTLLTAVVLCRAIQSVTGIKAGIKWPNDLLIKGKKVSGILLETSAEDERIQNIVAGVGISVNLLESDYPQELRDKATSLRIESGKDVSREQLITAFFKEFEYWYQLYLEQGFAPIKLLWEALSVTLQQKVSMNTPKGAIEGIAEGLDDFGALIVKLPDGTITKLYSGEIS
jgi:BirA family biotin operon repressor/biotin-[acetyl-CoA-carboxylase] ligase